MHEYIVLSGRPICTYMGGRQLFLTSLLHTSRILPKPPGDLHPIVVDVYFSVSAVLIITNNIIQYVCDIICFTTYPSPRPITTV